MKTKACGEKRRNRTGSSHKEKGSNLMHDKGSYYQRDRGKALLVIISNSPGILNFIIITKL